MRYLVSGAQGLIGRYLAARILDAEGDAEVLGIGRSRQIDGLFTHAITAGGERRLAPVPASVLASFDGRYRYRSLRLLETERLRELVREFQPDFVFHLASALSSAPERDLFETNVEGTASLMEALTAAPKAAVILGSSASVYGEPALLPIPESHPCRPVDVYGVTKLAAEHLLRVKASGTGAPFVIARIFNVVGPGQAETHVCGRLASQLASLPASGSRVLEVGQLGTTRDFIDVRDVASALHLLALKGERGSTYNVASGQETAIYVILAELVRIAGFAAEIAIARHGDRPAGVTRHVADVSRLRRAGFEPAHPIAASLRDLLEYHLRLLRPGLTAPAAAWRLQGPPA